MRSKDIQIENNGVGQSISLNTTDSYYKRRIVNEIGISEDQNTVLSPNYIGTFGKSELNPKNPTYSFKIFEEDIDGNIQINYLNLNGRPYPWRKEGNKNFKSYHRKRLKKPVKIKKDGKEEEQKYYQEKGSPSFPFFTPGIIKKYLAKEPIETLIVTEGEIKAFVGDLFGLDIIGIPSIHGFYDSESGIKGKVHEDIEELIVACRVKNIIYLTDADTLVIKWEEQKDLAKRQNLFYSAVKNFRESLQKRLDDSTVQNFYFMHIKTKFNESGAKGFDDLLIKFKAQVDDIKNDLYKFQFALKYFSGHIITDPNFHKGLRNYFGLTDVNLFYQTYRDFIGNREFRFGQSRYEFNGEDVVYVRHEDADRYLRIGADWFKIIKFPNFKTGQIEERMDPYRISEILRDYKRFPGFIEQINKYDAFCSVPDFTENYKRVHYGCYNVMHPLTHEIKPGSIDKSIRFVKHLFNGKGNLSYSFNEETKEITFSEEKLLGDPFTIALDYLTILLNKPMQKLPVPCLVSQEQETGKSTFLKWLKAIFGTNAVILNNERFGTNFNAHFATKFIIGIDEGFLDVDKKAEKERLKQMVTSETQFLENKNQNIKEFDFYGKIIICSNDADKIMKMDENDRRWFIVRVPKLEKKIPDFEKDLVSEIPHWLYFLMNREIFHPKEADLWFKTEYILTEQFFKILESTKSRIDKTVEGFISDMFLTYRVPVIKMHASWLLKQLNESIKYRIDSNDLRAYLQDKRKLKPSDAPKHIRIPIGFKMNHDTIATHNGLPDGKPVIEEFYTVSRHYTFNVDEWLTPEELIKFYEPWTTQLEQEKKAKLPF